MRARISRLTSLTPFKLPPLARGAYIPASPRELVMPPAAPISAACAAGKLYPNTPSGPGIIYPAVLNITRVCREADSASAAYIGESGAPGLGGSAEIIRDTRDLYT